MSDKENEGKEEPDLDALVKQGMLKEMRQEVQEKPMEESLLGQAKDAQKDAAKGRRGNVSYNSNSVRVSDTVGAAILGILSVILLFALLLAHRRERKRR